MPQLIWSTKNRPGPEPANLRFESYIYPRGVGYPREQPENHIILGDNLKVMSALLSEYEGKISLIYADPPFFTNRRYPARVGRDEDSRKPDEWELAEGYADHWPDVDTYLDMLYPRLVMMHRLLSPRGTLYLHLDWHANSYARLLLDEIFGPDRLLNEIVWVYHGPSPIRSAFNRKHDTILAYTKSEDYTFNVDDVREPYSPNTVKTFRSSSKAGFGKVPDLKRGKVPEDWWYFPVVARLHTERTGYPTQKPEALMERIILASSNPGDLVADFFAGSGTTAVVAERLGRRFVCNDIKWRAVHTTRSRLVKAAGKPFALQLLSEIPSQVNSSDGSNFENLSVRIDDCSLEFKCDSVSSIDFWEADPAWEGDIFRSAVQAVRPRKKRTIQDKLDLPTSPGEDPICVRFVSVSGHRKQVVMHPDRV